MPRFMSLIRVAENGAPAAGPSPELFEEMDKLIAEMTKAGVMLDTGGLRPAEESLLIRSDYGTITVTDGPFAETKEVVGGYAVLQTKTKDEAVEWTKRFLRVHGTEWDVSCEVRQIEEPPPAG
jgi:hypothetical protein